MFNRFNNCCPRQQCCPQKECPVMEPVINKCCEKEFVYEVPHICPIHTHVVNKRIYNHTYTPQYTYSEEDQIINNDPGSCCQFANNNF